MIASIKKFKFRSCFCQKNFISYSTISKSKYLAGLCVNRVVRSIPCCYNNIIMYIIIVLRSMTTMNNEALSYAKPSENCTIAFQVRQRHYSWQCCVCCACKCTSHKNVQYYMPLLNRNRSHVCLVSSNYKQSGGTTCAAVDSPEGPLVLLWIVWGDRSGGGPVKV